MNEGEFCSRACDQARAQYPSWTKSNERTLVEPYEYLESQPGSGFRSQMISAFNTWIGAPAYAVEIISEVIGMLHAASLMFDDIEDGSELRRGGPVTHSLYGVARTINTAGYTLFLALDRLCSSTDDPVLVGQLVNAYKLELIALHRGQGLDIYWRESRVCPTEQEYIDMILGKTAGLFRLAIRFMVIYSPNKDLINEEELLTLSNLLGIIYQIRDDYLNLQSEQFATRKGFAEDLTEGKFSFPIIHAVRTDTHGRILSILSQRTKDDNVKRLTVDYMDKVTDTFGYTRRILNELLQDSKNSIEKLGGNEVLSLILQKLSV